MDVDEFIYSGILKFLKRRSQKAEAQQSNVVYLNDIKPRLTLIACALTGKSIELFPAEKEGGYKNNSFFLPASMTLFEMREDNLAFYFFRVAFLSFQHQLGLNYINTSETSPELARKVAFEKSTDVLNALAPNLPGVIEIHTNLLKKLKTLNNINPKVGFHWLYGKWMTNSKDFEQGTPLQNFSEELNRAMATEVKTTLQTKAVENIKTVEIDKKMQEDYVLTHNFEKVETAEEFDGTWRDFDGDDQLADHEDALNELQMKYAVRTDDTAHSVYQTDFLENTHVSESAEADIKTTALLYDEWDYKKRQYKPAYCRLYPEKITGSNTVYYTTTIRKFYSLLSELRKLLASVNNKMQTQRRQNDGSEFDLDCVTDVYVEIHNKRSPNESIYLSTRKKEKDISITLLLDTSLSSDGFSDGNRIIDVEKQVAILFGEILKENGIDFSISGFHSKTRNYSTYSIIKDFDEPWEKAKYTVGDVQPGGYTRIGVALRHSGQLLKNRDSLKKWLIVLSDGKPNDYDRYEGSYGLNDVKQALRELKQNHINYYALAIEANAKQYLPQMFGAKHFQILSSPDELLTSLVTLYEQIRFS